jgi:hypothetical protein
VPFVVVGFTLSSSSFVRVWHVAYAVFEQLGCSLTAVEVGVVFVWTIRLVARLQYETELGVRKERQVIRVYI